MAALGFAGCSMPSVDRALWALRTWLDSWPGIGDVAAGMYRQRFDWQLTQYDDRLCSTGGLFLLDEKTASARVVDGCVLHCYLRLEDLEVVGVGPIVARQRIVTAVVVFDASARLERWRFEYEKRAADAA